MGLLLVIAQTMKVAGTKTGEYVKYQHEVFHPFLIILSERGAGTPRVREPMAELSPCVRNTCCWRGEAVGPSHSRWWSLNNRPAHILQVPVSHYLASIAMDVERARSGDSHESSD